MEPHPHVHCVVAAGGLSPDHTDWLRTPSTFFLPVKVLSRVFRGKFIAGLRRAFRAQQLRFFGRCASLENDVAFNAFARSLYREDWVVYAKPPFGGAQHVLHYLARYTHRVAISNHRLLAVTDSTVSFRWKDYAHGSQLRKMTLSSSEFLRRFLQHVLPRGFPRIRYFGWMANRRKSLLSVCRTLLQQPAPTLPSSQSAARPSHRCPRCNGAMYVVQRLSAAQVYFIALPERGRLDTS